MADRVAKDGRDINVVISIPLPPLAELAGPVGREQDVAITIGFARERSHQLLGINL